LSYSFSLSHNSIDGRTGKDFVKDDGRGGECKKPPWVDGGSLLDVGRLQRYIAIASTKKVL
jgi:hypothetical protein